jgi:hypothetical protein
MKRTVAQRNIPNIATGTTQNVSWLQQESNKSFVFNVRRTGR